MLSSSAEGVIRGEETDAALEARGRATLERHGWKVDYVAIRDDADDDRPRGAHNRIVYAAATLGSTRLIDNVDVRRAEHG